MAEINDPKDRDEVIDGKAEPFDPAADYQDINEFDNDRESYEQFASTFSSSSIAELESDLDI